MENFKGFEFLDELCEENTDFSNSVLEGISNGCIRKFDNREWELIKKQNYVSLINGVEDFFDMFVLGYNKGNCVGASRQLSYSYDDVDIVSGRVDILVGTLNAEKEGGHCWLENDVHIIDTSLLLVIDKKIASKLGYHEEQRVTSYHLENSAQYVARKKYVNDQDLMKNK